MFLETVDQFAASAVAKSAFLKRSPLGFWISAMMAGAYVGLGIILIFSIGSDADPAYRGLIMGASFGIALTLVIFAGSELFTGHTMVMSLGVLRGKVTLGELGACWTMSWLGNLAGCAVLAAVVRRRRRRSDAPFEKQLHHGRRHGKDDGAGGLALCPGGSLQLARLPRDLDGRADAKRCGEVHRHLLVPVRIHR